MLIPSDVSTNDLSKAANEFTSEDIADYLPYVKLDECIEKFMDIENDVDGDMMFDGIDDNTLETVLGIDIAKNRLRQNSSNGNTKVNFLLCYIDM